MKNLGWVFFLTGFINSCGMNSMNRETNIQSIEERNVSYTARPTSDAPLKKRVLILPFIDEKVTRSQVVVQSAREAVIRALTQTQSFVIVRNSDLPQDPGKFLNENREYDLEKLAPIASSLGISAIIEGKILEVKAKRIGDQVGIFRQVNARVETKVRLRIMAARNGRIILEDVRSGNIESSTTRVAEYSFSDKYLEEDPKLVNMSIHKAFNGTVSNIVRAIDKISWQGLVALVSGERVFINAGRLSGIQVGDILKVTEDGEEIFDPDTGAFIGKAPGRMKGTVEVVSYFGKDGAICLVHSGSGFKENDQVELY
ncbi:MAG: hypothetical protein H6625_13875 [Bdellovibrionaceae bacterium]|nr:hypothetical protein [Pseudobdellovibrionaceae bacterium]